MGLRTPPGRIALLALAALALATGIAGGLARLGAAPAPATGIAFHGALMVSGFLGTVISLERAVALGGTLAYAAPLASGLATVALLAGWHALAAALWIVAALALFAASVAIVRRQRALHTVLLAVAALAWAGGGVAHGAGAWGAAPAWWFAFLVLTIGAERLEMTRLARRPRAAAPLFVAVTAALLLAAALAPLAPDAGRVAFGLSLVALAAWFAAFDIARRTIRMEGFARYAAVALLAGYAWLAVGGTAWALAPGRRDLALHALGLGFVFSMILAHAPVIVPVIARMRMTFTPFFYVPLGLLHASVALRALAAPADAALRAAAGVLNAAAIALFAATLAWTLAATPRRAGPRARSGADPA